MSTIAVAASSVPPSATGPLAVLLSVGSTAAAVGAVDPGLGTLLALTAPLLAVCVALQELAANTWTPPRGGRL